MNTVIYSYSVAGQDDAQRIRMFKAFRAGKIVAVQKAVSSRSAASVGASNVDINKGTEALLNNICVGSEAGHYEWLSTHLGGEHQPISFDKGDDINFDIDHAGAGTFNYALHILVAFGQA